MTLISHMALDRAIKGTEPLIINADIMQAMAGRLAAIDDLVARGASRTLAQATAGKVVTERRGERYDVRWEVGQ